LAEGRIFAPVEEKVLTYCLKAQASCISAMIIAHRRFDPPQLSPLTGSIAKRGYLACQPPIFTNMLLLQVEGYATMTSKNVIVFGESGAGKSSVVNMLRSPLAKVSSRASGYYLSERSIR
jgi:putative ribosome biogenesis GTPase RsgA